MRVIVTGGAGFIGSHVVDRLLAGGHDVAAVDNLSTGDRALVNPRATLHVCDIRSPRLHDVFADGRPDTVIHLAAQAAVPRSIADPVYDASVNVLGTIGVLAAARRAGVRRAVYISTGGAGYGDTDVLPTPEHHPMRPSSPYGVSKIAAECYVDCWTGLTGIPAVSLRLANVYGPRQNPLGEAGVTAIFARRIVRGEVCVIYGDGEQTRDYVYVGDVADAVARVLANPDVTGAINVGTGIPTSVNELHRRLSAAAGRREPARHAPARPGEQRQSVLDPTRAKTVLGWMPLTSLDDGLGKTTDYFRSEANDRR